MILNKQFSEIKDVDSNANRNSKVLLLKKKVLEAPYEICIERARYYTQVFKETEGEHPSIRAAKALKRTLEKMSIYILPEELIVGNRSSKLIATVIPIERGDINTIMDLYLNDLTERKVKPFKIDAKAKRELLDEILPYWRNKTVRHYKFEEWKNNNLIVFPKFGLFSIVRRIRQFGIKNIRNLTNLYIKGHVRELSRLKRELVASNPELVNTVFDVQGHIVLGFNILINLGFKSLKSKAIALKEKNPEKSAFYDATIMCCDALRSFAERFADLALEMSHSEKNAIRKKELLKISENMRNVPWNTPHNFYEAVQFLWFSHVIALISYGIMGVFAIGRPDQYLYPFYKKDLDAGLITREYAITLIEELFVKLSYNLLPLPSFGKGTGSELGGESNAATVGGVDKSGNDATNDLTYIFIDAIGNIKGMANSFSIRLHSKCSDDYLKKVADLFAITSGPAIYNDDIIVPALMKTGCSLEDARDYSIIGCVELSSSGNNYCNTSGNDISLVGILEKVLTNGKIRMMGRRTGVKTGKFTSFKTFDQILQSFKKQLAHSVEYIAKCVNEKDKVYAERFHNPYISILIENCLDNGKDVTQGGAKYNFGSITGRGIATAADSLLAIKKAVFDEQWLTLKDLQKALNKNFKKQEILRQKLINRVPKYGNDDDEADAMIKWVAENFCELVCNQKSMRGGSFRPGFFSYGMNVLDGSFLGATPNGRRAGEPVSNSISPSNGVERNGPTAVIKSCAKLNPINMSNGCSLNIKLNPGLLQKGERREKFVGMLKTFIDLKAMHSQFNVIDNNTLIDAQKHPDEYIDLVVRVSGYSAYFHDLGKAVQDDIIQRLEFNCH